MAATGCCPDDSAVRYTAREATAAFSDHDELLAAIEELEFAGFDRAQINLLTSGGAAADGALLPLGTWVDCHELAEGKAALVAGLFYVGSFAAVGVAVATGGGPIMLVAALVAGGGSSGALGIWLARCIGRRRTRGIAERLRRGDLLLQVETRSAEQERLAITILGHPLRDVRLHDLVRSRRAGPDLSPQPVAGYFRPSSAAVWPASSKARKGAGWLQHSS